MYYILLISELIDDYLEIFSIALLSHLYCIATFNFRKIHYRLIRVCISNFKANFISSIN